MRIRSAFPIKSFFFVFDILNFPLCPGRSFAHFSGSVILPVSIVFLKMPQCGSYRHSERIRYANTP